MIPAAALLCCRSSVAWTSPSLTRRRRSRSWTAPPPRARSPATLVAAWSGEGFRVRARFYRYARGGDEARDGFAGLLDALAQARPGRDRGGGDRARSIRAWPHRRGGRRRRGIRARRSPRRSSCRRPGASRCRPAPAAARRSRPGRCRPRPAGTGRDLRLALEAAEQGIDALDEVRVCLGGILVGDDRHAGLLKDVGLLAVGLGYAEARDRRQRPGRPQRALGGRGDLHRRLGRRRVELDDRGVVADAAEAGPAGVDVTALGDVLLAVGLIAAEQARRGRLVGPDAELDQLPGLADRHVGDAARREGPAVRRGDHVPRGHQRPGALEVSGR